VYRNQRGALARQPEIARRHAIALEEFEPSAEFIGDVTGDGLSELFVRDEPEKLQLLMLRWQGTPGPRQKSTWTLVERPLWELCVAPKARVQLAAPGKGERAGLFVLEPAQVLWVRFP
jgi:hypothetical protein